LQHHATSRDIMRSGAGGVRRHSTEGVAEEGRGGGSGSGGQTGVGSGSGSGRRAGVGSIRGSPYSLSGGSVSAEIRRERRFEGELLLAGGRGGYRWCRGPAGGTCRKGILHVLGLCRAESGEDVL